jgi:hypothetical protein
MLTVAIFEAVQQEAVEEKVEEQSSPWTSGPAIVLYLAAFKLIFQLLCASKYGFFGDELYYAAGSEHLDWGYYDHPPLVDLTMFIARHVFGDSLIGIRVLPALFGAALTWIVGTTARELGGGRFAQALAAIAVIATPIYMTFHHWLHMNAIEPLIWAGCTYLAIKSVKRNDPRYWIWIGALWGLGLENKYSTALYAAAVVCGLLLTPARKFLARREFWIGALVGGLIFLPNLIWLIRHNFPFLEWQRGIAARGDNLKPGPIDFVSQQLILTGLTCIVWLAAMGFFFFRKSGKPYRFVGWAFLIVFGFFAVTGAKVYYPAPLYATVFSGGAVLIEELTAGGWRRFRPAVVVLIALAAGILAPCFVPILPIDRVLAYQRALGLPLPICMERYMLTSELPSWFVMETGWDKLVAAIASVYNGLPPEERSRTGILASNYAPAGAIDLLGPKYGLPKAISTHMAYHMWGPRNYSGQTLILVENGTIPPLACTEFLFGARVDNPYMYAILNGPVEVCRGPRFDLQKVWPKLPYY